MLFLFINFILSKTVITFDSIPYWDIIKLYFGPLDEIEITVNKGFATFLGYLPKDFYIYVDAGTRYGPFDEESGLAGVFFNTMNYSVLMINNGLENISFLIDIDNYYPSYSSDFPVGFVKPSEKKVENLESPFIYYLDESGYKALLIIMTILLAIISFGSNELNHNN